MGESAKSASWRHCPEGRRVYGLRMLSQERRPDSALELEDAAPATHLGAGPHSSGCWQRCQLGFPSLREGLLRRAGLLARLAARGLLVVCRARWAGGRCPRRKTPRACPRALAAPPVTRCRLSALGRAAALLRALRARRERPRSTESARRASPAVPLIPIPALCCRPAAARPGFCPPPCAGPRGTQAGGRCGSNTRA
jgi:hypothetical protein